jgi:long-subunit acyl-CoA synthetase (AMP-forming)
MALPAWLLERAAADAGRPALGDGQHALTYGALADAATALAEWLQRQSIRVLGLLADNSPAWVVADLAARAAGIVRVPLPPFFSLAQQQHLLRAAGVDALLTDNALSATRLGLTHPRLPPASAQPLTLWRHPAPVATALPAGCARITFTSGSTGAPKGVCLGDDHLDRVGAALALRLQGVDCARHLCLLPLATLLEHVAGVEVPLRLGGEVVLLPGAETGLSGSSGLDLAAMTSAIARVQPSSLILLPQLLLALTTAAERGWRPPLSLRFCAVGGARVAPSLIARARAAGLPAYEGYGLSECGSVVALNVPGADRIGSVGQPLAHLQVRIDDGEIVVAGAGFLGYLGAGAAPASIATGDLGRLDDDGFLHVDGRCKNLIISSFGRNISPEWVEAELLRDGTLQQAVLFGEAQPWCGALLYAAPEVSNDHIESHIALVNRELPDYARVRRWRRLEQPLSFAAGELTANGRPRRADIERIHGEAIAALFSDASVLRSH